MDPRIQGVIYYHIGLSLQSIKEQMNIYSNLRNEERNEIFEDCLTLIMPYFYTHVMGWGVKMAVSLFPKMKPFTFYPF
jgi:hypothetical protein